MNGPLPLCCTSADTWTQPSSLCFLFSPCYLYSPCLLWDDGLLLCPFSFTSRMNVSLAGGPHSTLPLSRSVVKLSSSCGIALAVLKSEQLELPAWGCQEAGLANTPSLSGGRVLVALQKRFARSCFPPPGCINSNCQAQAFLLISCPHSCKYPQLTSLVHQAGLGLNRFSVLSLVPYLK